MLREPAMWMSSPFTRETSFFFLLHDSSTCRPKRDCLLFVARHTAVTLTRNAPHSRAQSPGISVSSVERSGVFFSRFWLSSRRSLGQCLLLGQRSRMNFFSQLIGSLFHQHYRNPHTQLTCDRHNSDSGSDLARVFSANPRKKSLSSSSCRIADHDAWMSLLLSRPSPVRVIDPRSVLSPV